MNTPDPRTSLLKRLGLAWCSCLFLIALFAPRQAEAQGSSTPTELALSASSIAENNAANATVGTLSTTDVDAGDTFTYTLVSGTGDTDNASFSISGDALQLTPSANYETRNSYAVRVRTTDAGGLFYEEAFTISISDVAENPSSISATGGSGTAITSPQLTARMVFANNGSTANLAEADALLAGSNVLSEFTGPIAKVDFADSNTDGSFAGVLPFPGEASIVPISNFALRVTGSIHVPTSGQWTFGVRSDDGSRIRIDGVTQLEDDSIHGEEERYVTVSLTAGMHSLDFLFFQNGGGAQVELFSAPGAHSSFNGDFTLITYAPISINEDVPANSLVTTFTAQDEDAGSTATFALVSGTGDDDNASFTLSSGGELTINNSPDYEVKNLYSIRVRATDGTGLTVDRVFEINISKVNQAPSDITLTPSSIEENNAAGAAVGTLAAVDADAGDTFTYTLVAGAGDADNADLFIVGDSLQLNVSADFETKPSYSVLVQAEDAAGATFEKSLTVSITNANEAPADLDLSNTSVDENVAANTTVGTFSTTDPDAGDTFTYSLVAGAGDTDNASFNISGSALRISAAPDFETKASYSIRVRTTDQGSLTLEETFTITVNNLNETATDITLTPSSIEENNAAGAAVGTLAAVDADAGDTFTYTLVAGAGDADNADFSIVGDSLQLNVSADFETKPSYSVLVQAEDAAGATFEKALTVTITNANEAPTDLDLSNTSVDENVAANTIVGTFSTTDPDAGNTFTYSLVAGAADTDNARFNISGSSLRISASPDFETQNTYEVRVRTTDADGLFYEEMFTITVNNLNETATDITLTPSSIEENNAAGAAVGTLAATDPDAGDTFTFTLVAGAGDADNADFSIIGDTLQLDVSADFETKASYNLRVQAEDAAGATFEKALTVSITNANEAPTALDLPDTSVDENVAANTTVGTFSTTDPDAGDTFTYSLVAGADDTDNASFNVSGSALRISASPDFETKASYSIRVRTTDQGSLTLEETFTITVNNLNETATDITLTPSSIQENNAAGAAVGTLAAVDADAGDTFTYTLVAGAGDADNADFSIVGDSLQLDVSADFETKASYNLRVQAEDAAGATFEKALTVTITDEPEAPTALDLSDTSVDENVAANTIVGTFSTTDPNVAATHTYSLVAGAGDTDNASFNISGSSLRISASPDFETQASYSIRVRTTNQANGSFFYEETFTITVNNLNETATDITLTPSSIQENNAAGAAVGTLAATDPDAGDTFTFTLVAGAGDADNADFSIVGDTLQLDVSADFETKPSYSVLVQAEDAAGATFEKALTVTITDEPEAPTALDLSDTSVDENVAANTIVGTFSTTDPDAGNTFTYSLVAGAADTDNARFNISGSSLRISASPDFETQNTYEFRVRTTDADGLFYEEMFTITVNNLNETATDITLTPSSIEENNAAGAGVGTLAATDPDEGDTFTFTLVAGAGDADNADFSIIGDTLQLDVSADFETKASYNLRVQAEDAAGATFEKALTVIITDEPEAPTALDLSDTSVDENVAANTTVGTFSTTDPNVAATHTYSLVAGADDTDNASFNISGSSLRISASPDFETQANYSIRVRTTNQANGSLFYEETFTITINDINDAPVISGGPVALTAVYDHEPATVVAVADVLADASVTYLDQDAADAAGVAVVGAAGAGLWEYSADGVSWASLGSVGNASALLLPGSYSLRYTPDYPGPDGGETASLTLRAWDQTSGVAGALGNATTQGGSSAFSTGTVLLSLQVQEDDRAPTLTDVEINEVSSYAVFEVTAVAEQLLLLSLGQDADPTTANATVSAFTLETLNAGSTAWVAHNPVDTIEVPASGTLLVRVGTSGEQDDAFEGSEVFTLVAAALSGASNAGTGTIRDDDEGPVFLAANLTATANDPTDPGYPVLDDDVVKFIQWGDAGSLADDSLLDATLATADATYPLLFEGLGQGLFDVSLEAGGMAASGLKLIAGQPCWSLTGASGAALTEVSFRFYKPGSTTEFKYLKNVIFRFEDAEQLEQFSGFSYWDGAGTKVTVPWNDSSVFTYSHTPTFTNSNTTVENGATPASQTQAGKWIQVNLSGRQVTGIEFSHRKRVSSAGSVVMTHLAGELAPGALDFGGTFSPLHVGADPGSQAEIPDYRSQATWSGGAPATVTQTPAPGTLLSIGIHAVSLTLDLGAGVIARQGFDINAGARASVNATPTVTAVTTTGASLGGTVSSLGNGGPLERGVVYSAFATNADPLLGGTGVTSVIRVGGRGTFTSPVSGLSASTTYAFKAYVTTLYGTTYSDVRFFTTDTGLTFSTGIASLTNQLVRPGESQGFTFSLAESTSAIFSGSGATAGLQWTLFNQVGTAVRSGSGDINFSRALAWGNYRLVVTNPGSAAETFSLNLDTAFPAEPQPDISVGPDATASSGIDVHGSASASQSAVIVSRRAATKTVFFLIDNDGTLADSMRIAGPGPDSRFRISYSLARKNVTAGVIAGVALTPVIDTNDAPVLLSARVAPDRTNPQIMERTIVNGRRTIVWGSRTFGPKYVTVTASTDADFTDTATFKVDTTP